MQKKFISIFFIKMSNIFKARWIIVKVKKLFDKESLLTIFTKDYWKILCTKKISSKEKNLDIWFIINFEIRVNEINKIHKINNIKISWEFESENKSFKCINSFLELIQILNSKLPNWLQIESLFNNIEFAILSKKLDYNKILLLKLKTLNNLWILKTENSNQTISRILNFIDKNNFKEIIKLTWINEEIEKELEKLLK